MSKRLNELGKMSSRDRSMIRLSPKGRGLVQQIAGALQRQPMSVVA
jgi:hypothetical protein